MGRQFQQLEQQNNHRAIPNDSKKMTKVTTLESLPEDIPMPIDDGVCDQLVLARFLYRASNVYRVSIARLDWQS